MNKRIRFTRGTFAAVVSGRIFAIGVLRADSGAVNALVDILTLAVHHSKTLGASNLKASDTIDADAWMNHILRVAFINV